MEDLNKSIYIKKLLFFILLLKFTWIMLLIIKIFIQKYTNGNNLQILEYIENITHGIYNISIGLLLIYLYNHLTKERVCISGRVKNYLYSYGILMIIGNIINMIHTDN